jgi:uncharacterized protein (DUF58 family)
MKALAPEQQQAIRQGQRAGARYRLEPPRLAPQGLAGARLGHRSGSSLEFMDHREYQPGDDIRRIDWAGYARSDRLIVKRYREEVSPHLDLLVDGSRSMKLAGSAKAAAALGLAAALATAAAEHHFTHTLWWAGQAVRRASQPGDQPHAWQGLEFEGDQPLDRTLARLGPAWRRQAVRIVISDLLWPGDPAGLLRQLANNAASLVVIQVLAKVDITPPRQGNLRLMDSETGEQLELFIDAQARQRFTQTFQRHQQTWREAAAAVGARLVTLTAEDVAAHWDLQELVRQQVLQVR